MIRIRSRLQVDGRDEHAVVLRRSTGRRVLYGTIASILLLAAVFGLSGTDSLEGLSPVGVFFYLVILLSSAGVAAYDHRLVFDRAKKVVVESTLIAAVQLQRRAWDLSEVTAIVLQTVELLRNEHSGPRAGGKGLLRREARMHRMGIETADGIRFVEDSSDAGELARIGQGLAEFIGVDYRVDTL